MQIPRFLAAMSGALLAATFAGDPAAGGAPGGAAPARRAGSGADREAGPSRAEPEDGAVDAPLGLDRFARLDLAGVSGGAEPAPAAPKAEDIKTPLLRKLLEKNVLTAEEAAELDKKQSTSLIDSLAERVKFGGLTYFGYVYNDRKQGNTTGDFELRRNYITVEAALTKGISFRSTLDVFTNGNGAAGNIEARMKYAYLYFKEILPRSGLEFGIVHRPWIDYEDSNSWLYRAIAQSFAENADGSGLFGSADLGANLRTFTKYFSSEIAVVNGENYDHLDRVGGSFFSNSIEGRGTIHALGTGDRKVDPWRDTYLNFSFNTVNSFKHNAGIPIPPGATGRFPGKFPDEYDHLVYQAHAVFNMPLFLVAAQYAYNQDRFQRGATNLDNHGFSVNGTVRPFVYLDAFGSQKDKWEAFGRFDYWDPDRAQFRRQFIYGIAYRLNRYVRLLANGITTEHRLDATDQNRAMFTAEVNW